jgi:hypothetical protein
MLCVRYLLLAWAPDSNFLICQQVRLRTKSIAAAIFVLGGLSCFQEWLDSKKLFARGYVSETTLRVSLATSNMIGHYCNCRLHVCVSFLEPCLWFCFLWLHCPLRASGTYQRQALNTQPSKKRNLDSKPQSWALGSICLGERIPECMCYTTNLLLFAPVPLLPLLHSTPHCCTPFPDPRHTWRHKCTLRRRSAITMFLNAAH